MRKARCVLTGPGPTRSGLQAYADSYTLSGCSTAARCGVFGRVAAHCTDPSGYGSCPGGADARPGWTDATLCDGAPVYQRRGGGARRSLAAAVASASPPPPKRPETEDAVRKIKDAPSSASPLPTWGGDSVDTAAAAMIGRAVPSA